VHAFVHDRHLIERGLRNYWGYNTIGFFAPHPEYLGRGGLGEVKTFVQVMHDAGLEVILDVVYNHTAEGSHMGPTLSFRGIDNRSYYYLMGGQERYYNDFTGTGNALELRHPYVLRMVTDSLRYWVQEVRVDGFRFDLATTLARVEGPYDQHASFLDAVAQDPVLSSVKLIAEPWDTGLGGYQVGNFPPGWAEWNGKYRDTVRRFWKGEEGQIAEMASRVSGSADIYNHRGRRPWASVNFITAHDGFTLRDLVSYDAKHNEANKEDNRDGADDNHSWNCGVEGDTGDPEVRALRLRQMRNLLTTLLLSQGVPMLLAGDEFARTQGGNNNPYCQDSEIGWLDWSLDAEGEALLAFTRRLIALRSKHIVFHRSRFFSGGRIPGTEVKDVTWLRADGREMTAADWGEAHAKMLCLLLSGEAGLMHLTARGEQEPDDTFLLVMNASHLEVAQRLPAGRDGAGWQVLVDTARPLGEDREQDGEPGEEIRLVPRSTMLLVQRAAA
jgi:glycogen operon protein